MLDLIESVDLKNKVLDNLNNNYQGFNIVINSSIKSDSKVYCESDAQIKTLVDFILLDIVSDISEVHILKSNSHAINKKIIRQLREDISKLYKSSNLYVTIQEKYSSDGSVRLDVYTVNVFGNRNRQVINLYFKESINSTEYLDSLYILDSYIVREQVSLFNRLGSHKKTVIVKTGVKIYNNYDYFGNSVFHRMCEKSIVVNNLDDCYNPCSEIVLDEPSNSVLPYDVDLSDLVYDNVKSSNISSVEKALLDNYKKLGTPDSIKSEKAELLELKDKLVAYQSLIDQQSTEIKNLTKIVLGDNSSELNEYRSLGIIDEIKEKLTMFHKLYSILFPKIESDIKKGKFDCIVDPESLRFLE